MGKQGSYLLLMVELVLLLDVFEDPNPELPPPVPETPETEPLPALPGSPMPVQKGLLLIERVTVVTY